MAHLSEFKEKKNMLTINEQERAAYMAGEIARAALLDRVAELETISRALSQENDILRDQLADMERFIE
jgi:hypothetical protein